MLLGQSICVVHGKSMEADFRSRFPDLGWQNVTFENPYGTMCDGTRCDALVVRCYFHSGSYVQFNLTKMETNCGAVLGSGLCVSAYTVEAGNKKTALQKWGLYWAIELSCRLGFSMMTWTLASYQGDIANLLAKMGFEKFFSTVNQRTHRQISLFARQVSNRNANPWKLPEVRKPKPKKKPAVAKKPVLKIRVPAPLPAAAKVSKTKVTARRKARVTTRKARAA